MHCLSPEVHLKSGAAGSPLGSHPAWHRPGTVVGVVVVVVVDVIGGGAAAAAAASVVVHPTSSLPSSQSGWPSQNIVLRLHCRPVVHIRKLSSSQWNIVVWVVVVLATDNVEGGAVAVVGQIRLWLAGQTSGLAGSVVFVAGVTVVVRVAVVAVVVVAVGMVVAALVVGIVVTALGAELPPLSAGVLRLELLPSSSSPSDPEPIGDPDPDPGPDPGPDTCPTPPVGSTAGPGDVVHTRVASTWAAPSGWLLKYR